MTIFSTSGPSIGLFRSPIRSTNAFFPSEILRNASLNTSAENSNFKSITDTSDTLSSFALPNSELSLILNSLFTDEITPSLPEYSYREEYKADEESVNMVTNVLEIYDKFKSVNDEKVTIPNCSMDTSIINDFDFDIASLDFDYGSFDFDFAPKRKDESTDNENKERPIKPLDLADDGIMNLSPFESNVSDNRGTLHRFKKLITKFQSKTMFGTTIQITPLEEDAFSRQIPLKDKLNPRLRMFSKREESEAPSGSIKFKNQVDMIVFNRNSIGLSDNEYISRYYTTPVGQESNWRSRRFSIRNFKRNNYQRRSSISLSRKVSRSISNFQAKTILKSKNNLNYETENFNSIKDDLLNCAAFLENFEKYELEKFQNESKIRTLRHNQLRNYYEQEIRDGVFN